MTTEAAKIIVGTKVEPSEAKGLDRSKMGVAIANAPRAAEAEGQVAYWGYTQCPWCGNIGRSVLDTDAVMWYTCGACGGAFRAVGHY